MIQILSVLHAVPDQTSYKPSLIGFNQLGPKHGGFMLAQARLGPRRIHHCMRAIGMAERAFEIMCRQANQRKTHGSKLADKQRVQESVASSRMEIDQARLLTQHDDASSRSRHLTFGCFRRIGRHARRSDVA